MNTATRMAHHPGWNLEVPGHGLYQLWEPHRGRQWTAAWTAEDGQDGSWGEGATPAEAMDAADFENRPRQALALAAHQ